MDDQINRTILDNFDVSSVENVQQEIYKMNGTEVLKGLENGSLHFITVPRDEFIDHTLLPEYITTHGFIIDTMLDSTDGHNEPSQQTSCFVTQHSTPQNLANANEIQLQSNLDESDRRLNAALFQIVKNGNIRIGGSSDTETQVIVTNKDLVNLSETQVADSSIKNENSNSLDTSTFLTFDDQQSLTNSLINDGQFRIFQQPSSNAHQQSQLHNISINSVNNSSLPQLAPIRRLNRNSKNSISLNATDPLNIDNLKHNSEIEQVQNFQQRPTAKKVLPHKKRITKKLKSIDVNQRDEHLFQQSDNSSKSTSNQIQFFSHINSDEVISINPTTQFSCQICGSSAESQLEFFSHLKQHYEPKNESEEISHIAITRDEPPSQKQFLSHQPQSDQHIQVSVNQQQLSTQFQQLPQIKRSNHQQLQQDKSQHNQSQSPLQNETTQFKSLSQIHQNNNIHNLQSTVNNTQSEQGYLITNKKGVESRDLSNVTNFTFDNFSPITSLTGHSHVTHTTITKDIIEAPHGYEILDTSIENHLRSANSHQVQISKPSDFLSLQSVNEQQISLTSRTLLNPTQGESKIMLQQQRKNSHEPKSQHSQQILQNNTIYSQSTLQNNSELAQNIFANTQYFETKFTGLPNQVLNLEQKIDAIRAENDLSHSISDRTNNIIKNETLVQSSLICQAPTSLSNQIHITNSQSDEMRSDEIDGTENITPSIGQLHDETTLHSNSQKSSTNGIVMLQRDEVEFSDSEDMLEGIRGVVDKVQESFDTGDEMEPMSPQRTTWFSNTVFSGKINSKSNVNAADSSFENTSSVENFQMFFKNDEINDNKKQSDGKFNTLCNEIILEQRKKISNENSIMNNKNNSNSLISTDNSASSTTNVVPLNSAIDKGIITIKMEHFSSDFDDSWSTEYDKVKNIDNRDNDKLSSFIKSRESSPFDKRIDSPVSVISEKEVLKDCGVLSGKKGRKKYFCEKCFKVFNSLNALKYHEFAHSGERPFPCDKCDKSFFAQNALRTHQRVHSGEKPFTCVECGRAFRQWGDLNYHKTSLHSNEKNFQCEFCGKAFSRKYSLVIHRRIHTQEKNYKCEFCPKTFRASSYLQNHRKIHTGEKPYVCLTCNKKFRVCGDLKRHQKIHERVTNPKTTFQVNKNLNLEKKENQSISLDNVVSIKLSDTVINIQTEDTKSNKNQTDLNSSVFMCTTSDNNLDQLFKTDNINTNNIKNISSTLPVNITDTNALTNFIKNDDSAKKIIQSSSPSLPPSVLSTSITKGSTTYIITELDDKSKANKKVLTKFKNKKIRELVM